MAISGWSTTATNNATVGSIDWAEGMAPAQVNNSARAMMVDQADWYRNSAEWIARADTATYVGATQFKFVGSNKSSIYSAGRRIKLVAATPGTIYGRITAVSTSASAGDTTVTVSWDSGTLVNETITSVTPGLIKGGLTAQSAYIGGFKGISTFSTTTVGSTSAAAWRTALGLGSIATQSSTAVTITGGTATLSGLTMTAGNKLAVGGGGTGSTSATLARTALGLGSIATQSSTGVSITGGTITGVSGTVKKFTSSQQTITSGGSLTLAHSLGAVPTRVEIYLVCQTGEYNYSNGDVLFGACGGGYYAQGSRAQGAGTVGDATNLNVRYGDYATVFLAPNKTTGANVDLTNGNWKAVFVAWL